MKTLFIWLLSFLVVTPTFAATDYTCLNDCLSKGYTYQYCKEACSYDTTPSEPDPTIIPREPKTDYACLNDCLSKGNMYEYCKEACSY
jgi:hypothetical protein